MKLNLGAGNLIMKDYINHDIRKHRPEIDIAFDLNDKEWRRAFNYIDFQFEMYGNNFDEIRAWDVVEHLDDVINFMNNCWNLLKPNGILDLKVCGWQNPNIHVDITHKSSGFATTSFDYFVLYTELGKTYNYYTDMKWEYVELPHYDRKSNILVRLIPIK